MIAKSAVAWAQFLRNVEEARRELRCSFSNAWFRGHESTSYELVPSLFRDACPDRMDRDREQALREFERQIASKAAAATRCDDNAAAVNREIKAKREAGDLEGADRLRARLLQYKDRAARLRQERRGAETQRQTLGALHYGERDAYVDFRFRSGSAPRSSWEVLAEMQHYGLPTRLLDWTEVLAIAVFFALKQHIQELLPYLREEALHGSTPALERRIRKHMKGIQRTPAVWILNPFLLARHSIGENSLLDITLYPDLDYYDRFFVRRDWPYDLHVPIYSPWRTQRLAAQQGMFTVQGIRRDPVCRGRGSADYLRKVELDPLACLYGVRHLVSFVGIDQFTIFRDTDNLCRRIREGFLSVTPSSQEP